jgi:predicted AAA+ superfamily ATPase
MITRIAAKQVKELSESFKAIAIVGPRQFGKTTLARDVFKGKWYVSFENPDNRRFMTEDPRGFLKYIRKAPFLMRRSAFLSYSPTFNKFWMKIRREVNLF